MKEKVEKLAAEAPESQERLRIYVGPQPAPSISNLPCGCTLPADQLNRSQQDYVLATVPEAVTWFA